MIRGCCKHSLAAALLYVFMNFVVLAIMYRSDGSAILPREYFVNAGMKRKPVMMLSSFYFIAKFFTDRLRISVFVFNSDLLRLGL